MLKDKHRESSLSCWKHETIGSENVKNKRVHECSSKRECTAFGFSFWSGLTRNYVIQLIIIILHTWIRIYTWLNTRIQRRKEKTALLVLLARFEYMPASFLSVDVCFMYFRDISTRNFRSICWQKLIYCEYVPRCLREITCTFV